MTRTTTTLLLILGLTAAFTTLFYDTGMGISLDAKKYFMDTTLHVKNAAGAEILTTKHSLDPWVVSGGVYLRF